MHKYKMSKTKSFSLFYFHGALLLLCFITILYYFINKLQIVFSLNKYINVLCQNAFTGCKIDCKITLKF